jgi:hypothetical protein
MLTCHIPQIIKKFTVRHLDAVGVSKAHPEFKELFGFVYRGTAFALVCQCVLLSDRVLTFYLREPQ